MPRPQAAEQRLEGAHSTVSHLRSRLSSQQQSSQHVSDCLRRLGASYKEWKASSDHALSRMANLQNRLELAGRRIGSVRGIEGNECDTHVVYIENSPQPSHQLARLFTLHIIPSGLIQALRVYRVNSRTRF